MCLWIPRRSGYRNRLYTTCRHDRNDKFTKANKTPQKPSVTFARATARQDAHGMHKSARPLTELAGANPRHAELPPLPHRAHRPAPSPEAAPGRRGAPSVEKVPRGLGDTISCTRGRWQACERSVRGYERQRRAHGHNVPLTCAPHGGQPGRALGVAGSCSRALASRLSHASASCCRFEEVAQVRDSSDALGQLEPRDALAAMSTPSFC